MLSSTGSYTIAEEMILATVLITGTSTGIGLATALAFGRAGHTVAATMRNPQRAPELANVAGREKLPVTVSAMDVDADASVTEAIGRIVRDMDRSTYSSTTRELSGAVRWRSSRWRSFAP